MAVLLNMAHAVPDILRGIDRLLNQSGTLEAAKFAFNQVVGICEQKKGNTEADLQLLNRSLQICHALLVKEKHQRFDYRTHKKVLRFDQFKLILDESIIVQGQDRAITSGLRSVFDLVQSSPRFSPAEYVILMDLAVTSLKLMGDHEAATQYQLTAESNIRRIWNKYPDKRFDYWKKEFHKLGTTPDIFASAVFGLSVLRPDLVNPDEVCQKLLSFNVALNTRLKILAEDVYSRNEQGQEADALEICKVLALQREADPSSNFRAKITAETARSLLDVCAICDQKGFHPQRSSILAALKDFYEDPSQKDNPETSSFYMLYASDAHERKEITTAKVYYMKYLSVAPKNHHSNILGAQIKLTEIVVDEAEKAFLVVGKERSHDLIQGVFRQIHVLLKQNKLLGYSYEDQIVGLLDNRAFI